MDPAAVTGDNRGSDAVRQASPAPIGPSPHRPDGVLWPEWTVMVPAYEQDTLPLLFAPEDVFLQYYAALEEKYARRRTHVSRAKNLCLQARHAFGRQQYRDVVRLLGEACHARHGFAAALDYQRVAAEIHQCWTAIHLASIGLAAPPPSTSAGGSGVDLALDLYQRAAVLVDNLATSMLHRVAMATASSDSALTVIHPLPWMTARHVPRGRRWEMYAAHRSVPLEGAEGGGIPTTDGGPHVTRMAVAYRQQRRRLLCVVSRLSFVLHANWSNVWARLGRYAVAAAHLETAASIVSFWEESFDMQPCRDIQPRRSRPPSFEEMGQQQPQPSAAAAPADRGGRSIMASIFGNDVAALKRCIAVRVGIAHTAASCEQLSSLVRGLIDPRHASAALEWLEEATVDLDVAADGPQETSCPDGAGVTARFSLVNSDLGAMTGAIDICLPTFFHAPEEGDAGAVTPGTSVASLVGGVPQGLSIASTGPLNLRLLTATDDPDRQLPLALIGEQPSVAASLRNCLSFLSSAALTRLSVGRRQLLKAHQCLFAVRLQQSNLADHPWGRYADHMAAIVDQVSEKDRCTERQLSKAQTRAADSLLAARLIRDLILSDRDRRGREGRERRALRAAVDADKELLDADPATLRAAFRLPPSRCESRGLLQRAKAAAAVGDVVLADSVDAMWAASVEGPSLKKGRPRPFQPAAVAPSNSGTSGTLLSPLEMARAVRRCLTPQVDVRSDTQAARQPASDGRASTSLGSNRRGGNGGAALGGCVMNDEDDGATCGNLPTRPATTSPHTGSRTRSSQAAHRRTLEELSVAKEQQRLRAALPSISAKSGVYRDVVRLMAHNEATLRQARDSRKREQLTAQAADIARRAHLSKIWARVAPIVLQPQQPPAVAAVSPANPTSE